MAEPVKFSHLLGRDYNTFILVNDYLSGGCCLDNDSIMLTREENVELVELVSELGKGCWESGKDKVGRGAPKEVLLGETVHFLAVVERISDVIIFNRSYAHHLGRLSCTYRLFCPIRVRYQGRDPAEAEQVRA